MQRQHIRILILLLILLVAICFILLRADARLEEIDQQMPEIGMRVSPSEVNLLYHSYHVLTSSASLKPYLKSVHHQNLSK